MSEENARRKSGCATFCSNFWPTKSNSYLLFARVHIHKASKIALFIQIIIDLILLLGVILIRYYHLLSIYLLSLISISLLFFGIFKNFYPLYLPYLGVHLGICIFGLISLVELIVNFDFVHDEFIIGTPKYFADSSANFWIFFAFYFLHFLITLVILYLVIFDFFYFKNHSKTAKSPEAIDENGEATAPPPPSEPPPEDSPSLPTPTPVYFLPYSSYKQFMNSSAFHPNTDNPRTRYDGYPSHRASSTPLHKPLVFPPVALKFFLIKPTNLVFSSPQCSGMTPLIRGDDGEGLPDRHM
ncbi:unnamed protein product [Bursaphelenchus xylophilus]|uniref:(pine wood nematode) hypothetical protein n=1 Tax=Bursaphelenchus xylophilus TaxID=6326 RepID=A0A1I7S9L4_BURXY|nr:unnamed protein product [Bursaphelenchus xylophilus]CAG9131943.1 unnamed protein product [Bursaphelenchus xylophilus]